MATVRSSGGTTAGGADKASLEIEMQNSLGATPELSAVPPYEPRSLNNLKDHAQKLGTKWPLVLVLVLFVALGAACLGGGLWITQQHMAAQVGQHKLATALQHSKLEAAQRQHSAELKAAQQQHSAELKAAQQQHSAELKAAQQQRNESLAVVQQQHKLEMTTALQHSAELEAAQQQHSAEFKAAQQRHSAELKAATAAAPRSVRWTITNHCGEPSPACVGQVNHGCGPRHKGVACGQGLFCDDQWCFEGCRDTPVRSGKEIERVEGMCDYLPCEISWLFDEGSPEPVGECLEAQCIASVRSAQQQHSAELEAAVGQCLEDNALRAELDTRQAAHCGQSLTHCSLTELEALQARS